MQPKLRVL